MKDKIKLIAETFIREDRAKQVFQYTDKRGFLKILLKFDFGQILLVA